jgi:hypothetical protein
MALTLRPTGGHSPVDRGRQDWTVLHGGKPVGCIYENTSASTSGDLRWFWSITVYVHQDAGVATSGKVPTLGEAKMAWLHRWRGWRSPAAAFGTLVSVIISRNGKPSNVLYTLVMQEGASP